MSKEKVELRQHMDFGQVLTYYFEFIKQNIKEYINIFLRYNGIFLLLLLGISYLLVSGFFGIITSAQNLGGSMGADEMSAAALLGLGFIGMFFVFILVAALNYSLSSIFMIEYVKTDDPDTPIDPKIVWKKTVDRLGNIIVFILLLIVIYIGFGIISVILAIIPLLGTIVQYIISFAMSAWVGIAFMVMLHERKGVGDSFGEAWALMTKNFWKSVGTNFVLNVIFWILVFFVLSVPGIILGLWTAHAIDEGQVLTNSIMYKLVWTIATCILLVFMAFGQSLMQFGNGVLYYSLNEKKYNQHLRVKIEQIGVRDE